MQTENRNFYSFLKCHLLLDSGKEHHAEEERHCSHPYRSCNLSGKMDLEQLVTITLDHSPFHTHMVSNRFLFSLVLACSPVIHLLPRRFPRQQKSFPNVSLQL